MASTRSGVLCVGSIVVDLAKVIDLVRAPSSTIPGQAHFSQYRTST